MASLAGSGRSGHTGACISAATCRCSTTQRAPQYLCTLTTCLAEMKTAVSDKKTPHPERQNRHTYWILYRN